MSPILGEEGADPVSIRRLARLLDDPARIKKRGRRGSSDANVPVREIDLGNSVSGPVDRGYDHGILGHIVSISVGELAFFPCSGVDNQAELVSVGKVGSVTVRIIQRGEVGNIGSAGGLGNDGSLVVGFGPEESVFFNGIFGRHQRDTVFSGAGESIRAVGKDRVAHGVAGVDNH